jgi:hypothetical protein
MALTKIKGAGINISAAEKLYFDGGGTTYIQESADGVLDFYADNVKMLELLEGATDYVWIPVDATKFAIGAGKDLNIYTSSDDAIIENITSDKDIIFKGNDGGSTITALTLDISAAGAATFNDKIIATELDISGNMDIDGTSNLDAVDIDGAVQIDATVTVGADDQGYDVIFYGDTASSNMTWDTSADDLILNDATLSIDQDDDANSIYIDSEATSANVMRFNDPATTTGTVFMIHGANALTTGKIAQFYSGSSDNSTRSLVDITNDHTSADNAVCLFIQQDGADASIELGGNGSIKFPGTQGASSDANSLDDYEEGYSTAGITAASGTITVGTSYLQDKLQYTMIGNVVHFKARLEVASNSSPSGELSITGLPVASNNPSGDAAGVCTVYFENATSAVGTDIIGIIPDGATSIAIRKSGQTDSGAGLANLVDDDTNFIITGSYWVSNT